MTAEHSIAARRAAALLLPLALWLPASPVSAQQVVTRTTTYTYDATTGQVKTETVEPGNDHCVQTSYTYDAYGNKKRVDVSPCSSTSAAASFTPRWTQNDFEASTDASNPYPAGAYQTRTWSGSGGTTLTEARATYDPRFGTSASQTEIALGDATHGHDLSKKTEYDGFGRVVNEYTPINRDGSGNLVYARLNYSYVYCQGANASGSGACLNLPAQTVTVNYPSQRLVDPATGTPTSTATMNFVSAYYVETTPYDSAGNVVGAKTRVHYDSLHR